MSVFAYLELDSDTDDETYVPSEPADDTDERPYMRSECVDQRMTFAMPFLMTTMKLRISL
jgi:hypothetical protein